MTDDNLSYCIHHFIMYKNTESVGHTPGTLILAYYNSKNFKKKKKLMDRYMENKSLSYTLQTISEPK